MSRPLGGGPVMIGAIASGVGLRDALGVPAASRSWSPWPPA